jgi:Co/Zn/Cd efflux system component
MSSGCHSCSTDTRPLNYNQKIVLWIALVLNAVMFFAELITSFVADSVALKADAIDFLGDAANYGVSLFVLGMSIGTRARASLLKAYTMAAFGLWVIGSAVFSWIAQSQPEASLMGKLGVTAMLVNLLVAGLLFKFRNGDSNMKSVWICTRNDVIGNIAVIIAAAGVVATSSGWPDLVVALGMGLLAIFSAREVIIDANRELKSQEVCS